MVDEVKARVDWKGRAGRRISPGLDFHLKLKCNFCCDKFIPCWRVKMLSCAIHHYDRATAGLAMPQQLGGEEVEVQVVRGQTGRPSNRPGWQSWQGTMRWHLWLCVNTSTSMVILGAGWRMANSVCRVCWEGDNRTRACRSLQGFFKALILFFVNQQFRSLERLSG